MKDRIEITDNTLRIKGIRSSIFDDDYGVMALPPFKDMPQGEFINFWVNWIKRHTNIAEFMYGNSYLPHCDFIGGKYVSYETGSKANKRIGFMKDEWKAFIKWAGIKYTDIWGISQKELNSMFMEFYMSRCSYKFNNALNAMMDYVRRKRAEMTGKERAYEVIKATEANAQCLTDDEFWVKGCRPYLLDFVIHKTVKGFLIEMILLEALTEKLGGYFVESSMEDEFKGIDGYFVSNGEKYKICLKSNTFKGTKKQSVINEERLVYYDFDGNDIVFRFETGGDILIMNDTCFFNTQNNI